MSGASSDDSTDRRDGERSARFLSWAGIIFVVLAFICIVSVVCLILLPIAFGTSTGGIPASDHMFEAILARYAEHIILVLTGMIAALIGAGLLKASGRSSVSSIPSWDLDIIRDAIRDGKEEPINQYIRVRSLSGFTGGFTKVGLTGLPLTTVGLTVLFTILALAFYSEDKIFSSVFDLAKLTLGAFIGSYVQRQVERSGQDKSAGGTSPPRPSLPA